MQDIFTYYNYFIPRILIIISFSFFLRVALIYCGQKWINTFAHSMSLLLLPLITFCVTSVISNNLALSLGLVGALSIVRFRNPVKSPLELTIYFLCISLGICASVYLEWVIFLSALSIGSIFMMGFFNRAKISFTGNPLFKPSFSEGNSLEVLEIQSNKLFTEYLNHFELISFSKSDNVFIYRLASTNKKSLIDLSEKLSNNENIVSISYTSA